MNKLVVFVIVAASLLMLTGCGRFGPTDKTKGELVTQVDIHKGVKGLTMEFVKGQPASTIWEGTGFPITLQLKNEGAYNIQRGMLAITGNLYFTTDPNLQFSLEGKSEFNPEGEFSFEKFDATTLLVDGDKTDSFFVMACYPYKTYASATICINPRIIEEEKRTEECSIGTVSLSGGQGAPVSVTSVEEEMIPIGDGLFRLNIKINIANNGGGRVSAYDLNTYEKDCIGLALKPEEFGLINVEGISFSSYSLNSGEFPIKCQNAPGNKFKLDSTGKYKLECYAKIDSEFMGSAAFTTPLTVELAYGYSQLSESKTITIKDYQANK